MNVKANTAEYFHLGNLSRKYIEIFILYLQYFCNLKLFQNKKLK